MGTCARCGNEGIHVIRAYDDRIFPDLVCPLCVMAGKACEISLDDPLMRPVAFIARGLIGQEPFRTLMKESERQRRNPKAVKDELASIRERKRLVDRKVITGGPNRPPVNRHEKRAVAKLAEREKGKS